MTKFSGSSCLCAKLTLAGLLACGLISTSPALAQAPTVTPAPPAQVPVPLSHIYPLAKPIQAPNVVIDVSDDPAAADWAAEAKVLVQQWFPTISAYLATEQYHPPKNIHLIFKKTLDAPAYTTGFGKHDAAITIDGEWIAAHPTDFGMVIHELTHVVQSYPDQSYKSAGWLVEGIADYIRFYKYEPDFPRSQVNPRDPSKASYHDAYRTTASFLAYVTNKYDFGLVSKLDAGLRAGTYSDALWQTITGKSVDDLWAEYIVDLTANRD